MAYGDPININPPAYGTDPSQPIGGLPPGIETPSQIKRRQRMAENLLQNAGDVSPKKHWLQAAAQILSGALGGYQERKANEADKARSQYLGEALKGNLTTDQLDQLGIASGEDVPLTTIAQNRRAEQIAQDRATAMEQAAQLRNSGYYGTLIKTWDAKENRYRFFQPGKQGQPGLEVQLPEGVTPLESQQWLNTGTGFTAAPKYGPGPSDNPVPPTQQQPGQTPPQTMPGQTAQPVPNAQPMPSFPSTVPIDVTGKAKATEIGKSQGEAGQLLPQAAQVRDQTLAQINMVYNHPAMSKSVGYLNSMQPDWWASVRDPQILDFRSRVKQLVGDSFLTAYTTLKGGGQIANLEGEKAQMAVYRMNQATDEKSFKTALDDYRTAINTGFAAMEQKAGNVPGVSPQLSPSLGNDPNDPLGLHK